ncbi:hypothetical protein B0H19DRAFT_1250196 [Mycena capillaripes]|nr:hypothetical protein B0H19DRAFT_1250196 [Mycena capillaripes]
MNPQNHSQNLREQADSLKGMFQPVLRQRNPHVSIPGTSAFSALHKVSPTPINLPTPDYSHMNHSFSSGFQFHPPLTPQSIPRSTSHLPHPSALLPLELSTCVENVDPFQSSHLPDLSPDYPNSELDGLAQDSYVFHCISPVDILIQVLDTDNMVYDRYRSNLYHDDSTKLAKLLAKIMMHHKGRRKLFECMCPTLEDFSCDVVADEMDERRRNTMLPSIAAVTTEFIEKWRLEEDVDSTPFLTCILTTVAQTERCARQTIDTLFRCGLSVCYDLVLNLIKLVGNHCVEDTIIAAATDPTNFNYDNINFSSSIFFEQRGSSGPAKVTSGTFGILYGLRNVKWEHMLIAPIMKPTLSHLGTFHDQLIVTIIGCLFEYNKGFEEHATRASAIEEATTRRNLLFHDEIYINQLKRTPESLSKYAIPGFHDQLTNARVRAAQLMRVHDVTAWERREIFQLRFGLFHLCLNLVWAILHVHRGSVNELGSLTYFFVFMEKARLGDDQPNYHSLLAALKQALHGLLLGAWLKECGFPSFESFAESKPNPQTLRNIASQILDKYATPLTTANSSDFETTEASVSDNELTTSESGSEADNASSSKPPPPLPIDPKDDAAHHNICLLLRDLLMLAVLVRAISDGDIGRVEVLLLHLAMMFHRSGCNKYCTEILHFLHNLKHIWTPEFADIMLDNMILCISGQGPGHCMPVDLNIEHLIGYLKILLQAKGMSSTWDRLGNVSAAIVDLQQVKKKIGEALSTAYSSIGHTTPDTSHLSGEAKLKLSTLGTFNKKLQAMIEGYGFEEEEDECPTVAYGPADSTDE